MLMLSAETLTYSILQIDFDSKQSSSLICLHDAEAVDVGRPGFEPWASAVIIKPTIYHCPRLMGGVGGPRS